MKDDQELCLCFHVTRRKVLQFIRVNRPKHASQLSECYGAGTGCGWCRPYLRKLLDESNPDAAALPDAQQYASERAAYRKSKEADN